MKCIIIDVYNIYDRFSEKFINEQQLMYKNRVTIYRYDLRKIEDFAIPNDQLDRYKIGMVIDDWAEFRTEGEGVITNVYFNE